jgi:hypothetical protein
MNRYILLDFSKYTTNIHFIVFENFLLRLVEFHDFNSTSTHSYYIRWNKNINLGRKLDKIIYTKRNFNLFLNYKFLLKLWKNTDSDKFVEEIRTKKKKFLGNYLFILEPLGFIDYISDDLKKYKAKYLNLSDPSYHWNYFDHYSGFNRLFWFGQIGLSDFLQTYKREFWNILYSTKIYKWFFPPDQYY